MVRLIFLTLSFLIFSIFSFSQLNEHNIWEIVNPQKGITQDGLMKNFYESRILGDSDSLLLFKSKQDAKGIVHNTFQQFHNGVLIENAQLTIHSKDGKLLLYNGVLHSNIQKYLTNNSISESDAKSVVLSHVNAEVYAWEDSEYIKMINDATAGKAGSLNLDPELVILNTSLNKYTLCYKMEVYSLKPHGRHLIYVNANDGSIVRDVDMLQHVNGACGTLHHGTQNVDFESPASGVYELTDNSRNIETYLMSNSSYSSALIPTSTSINWNNFTANNRAALDIHWGTEVVFDFLNSFGINSFDNNGALIRSYANYGSNYNSQNNAFWNGFFLTYGSGGGSTFPDPLSTIDVIAHEFAHALTQHYGGELYYFGESGAINESMSDMIASLVEIHVNSSANFNGLALNEWVISDLNGSGIRDLSNPNAFNHPDTYQGTNWLSTTSSFDNGGVHFNSGVGNFWFYLLANGGVGVNDNNDAYNVSPLVPSEITEVLLSAYDYMNSNASYLDFRNATIAAAHFLYNDCSKTQKIIDAWNAVGVGDPNEGCPNVVFEIRNLRSQFCVGDDTTFVNNYVNSPAHTYSWKLDGSPITMPFTMSLAGVSVLELLVVDNATGLVSVDSIHLFVSNCQPIIDTDKGIWYFGYKKGFNFSSGLGVPTTYPWENYETTHSYTRNGELEYYISATPTISVDWQMKVVDKNHNSIATIPPVVASSSQIGSSAISPVESNGHRYINVLLNSTHDHQISNISGLYKVVLDIITPGSPVFVSIDPVPAPPGANFDHNGAVNSRESTAIIPGCNSYEYWVVIGSYNNGFGMSLFKLDYGPVTGSPQGDITFVSHTPGGGLGRSKRVSPNGNYLVVHDVLFSFDRVTGVFSFLTYLPDGGGFSGAFSPNSRFYYTSENNMVFQYDVLATDIPGSQVLIGHAPNESINSSSNSAMQLGPDGKIYMAFRGGLNGYTSPGGGLYNSSMAVVNNPNEKEINGETLYNRDAYFVNQAFRSSFKPTFPAFTDAKRAVEEPITLTVATANCYDVTLVAPSCKAYYSWGFGDGDTLALSAQSSVNHQYSAPGTYTMSLTSHFNGVDTTVYETIEIGFTDSIAIIAPDSICNSTFTMIQGTPGYAYYIWSVVSGSAIINNPSSGSPVTGVTWLSHGNVELSLTVLDIDGCSKTISKIVYITPGDQPPIPTVPMLDTIMSECAPLNLPVPLAHDKCGAMVYGTTSDLPVVSAGTTNVAWTFEDVDGFDTVQYQTVIITPIDNSVTQSGNLLTSNATGGYQYQWIDCSTNTPISGATNHNFSPTIAGQYAVVVNNGICDVVSSCFEHVGLGQYELEGADPISIYPNPVDDVLTIITEKLYKYKLTNELGQDVLESYKNTIEMSHLSSGIYYLNVYSLKNKWVGTWQVVKK